MTSNVYGVDSDDDDDLLAPVYYGAEEDLEEEGDGGHSDSDKIVRIWVEDGRLTKVRVSPVWYTKLRGRTLEAVFQQALARANVGVADAPEPPEIGPGGELPELDAIPAADPGAGEFDDVDFSALPRLSRRTLAAMAALQQDLLQRREQALAQRRARPAPATPDPTVGRSKGVRVRLDPTGLAEAVEFEKSWLNEAHAGTICTHVVLAASDAYRRHNPVEREPDELDEVLQEHRFVSAALRAMLNPGTRR